VALVAGVKACSAAANDRFHSADQLQQLAKKKPDGFKKALS